MKGFPGITDNDWNRNVLRHRAYGRIMADSERSGRRMGLGDAWIAACAVRHGLPLVTHNAKDFQGVDALQVITEPDDENPRRR